MVYALLWWIWSNLCAYLFYISIETSVVQWMILSIRKKIISLKYFLFQQRAIRFCVGNIHAYLYLHSWIETSVIYKTKQENDFKSSTDYISNRNMQINVLVALILKMIQTADLKSKCMKVIVIIRLKNKGYNQLCTCFFYFVLAVFHLTLKMWKIFDTENVIKDFVYIRFIYYYLFIYLFVRFFT